MWINGITEIRRHGSKLRRIYGITNLRIHGYSIMTEYKKTYKKGTYGKKESRKDESTETRINGNKMCSTNVEKIDNSWRIKLNSLSLQLKRKEKVCVHTILR